MGRSDRKSNRPKQGRGLRKLRFDSLEDRRLLAGLTVFVFDDANGSAGIDSGEVGRPDQIVFLDDDSDGTLDPGEAWARTSTQGQAVFHDLEPGVYHPTLFGSRLDTVQTTPVTSASNGVVHPLAELNSILGWQNDNQIWVARSNAVSNSIDLFDISSDLVLQSIPLTGRIISASMDLSTHTAVAVLQSTTTPQRSLATIDLNAKTAVIVPGSQGLSWESVIHSNRGFIVKSSALIDGTSLSRLDGSGNLTPIPGLALENGSQVWASEKAPFLFVAQPQASLESSEVTLQSYRLDGSSAVSIGNRTFNNSIDIQAVDPQGKFLAVKDSAGKTLIIENKLNLGEAMIYGEPITKIAFDSSNGTILSLAADSQQIEIRKLANGALVGKLDIKDANSAIDLQGDLLLSPFAKRIIALSSNGLYVHSLSEKASLTVSVDSADGDYRGILGTQVTGENTPPTFSGLDRVELAEDTQVNLDHELLQQNTIDADGDSVSVFVVHAPLHGQLDWSPLLGGKYFPNQDFEGNDSIVLQAFDGRNWSSPKRVDLKIDSVNDLPSGFDVQIAPIPENSAGGTELGLVTVLDPDRDASYHVSVSDPRLLVVNGILKLADNAKIDFESEETITFEIIATDSNHPEDSVFRTVTVDIVDENDPPTDMSIDIQDLPENKKGAILGTVSVNDQDKGNSYRWLLSDSRFQIVNGKLVLQDDISADFEAQSEIPLTLTASEQSSGGNQLTKSIVIHVKNEDDPTLGIRLEKQSVVERVRGFKVGKVTVIDQDVDEVFTLQVSDQRFVVVEGTLKLKPGIFVDIANGQSIPLEITATSQTTGKSYTQTMQLQVTANSSPWRNIDNPMDVDGDGRVSPLDPLRIVNHINRFGIHPVGDPPDKTEGEQGGDFLDVNGDGVVTPLDIIIVINHLNSRGSSGPGGSGSSGGSSGGSGGGSGGGGVGEGEGLIADAVPPQTIDISLSAYLADHSDAMGPKRKRT